MGVDQGSAEETPRTHRPPGSAVPIKVGGAVSAGWAIALLIILAVTGDGLVRVVGVLGGIAAAIGAIFQQISFPRVSRRIAVRGMVALLAIDVVATAGWLSWTVYERNRPIDVTAQVSLDRNMAALPGAIAYFDVDVTAARSRIVIVFQTADHNTDSGSCTPNTELEVTPRMFGNPGPTRRAVPGEPFPLDLPSHARHVHLELLVDNTRNDTNCAVDISVSSATLTNG